MSPVDLGGPPRRRVCRDRGTARRVRPRRDPRRTDGRCPAPALTRGRVARGGGTKRGGGPLIASGGPPSRGGGLSPVRVPATGATHGDVGDCVGRVRGYGRGGGMARRVPAVGVALGWGGSVLPRDPRRGILGGTLGGRCPATAAPRPVAAIRCREAPAHPYAVVRRTRRRGGAMRGPAGPSGWGRRRAGTACACCARYSTSWSPASSSSCSWMML